jgi:hypothetical protein
MKTKDGDIWRFRAKSKELIFEIIDKNLSGKNKYLWSIDIQVYQNDDGIYNIIMHYIYYCIDTPQTYTYAKIVDDSTYKAIDSTYKAIDSYLDNENNEEVFIFKKIKKQFEAYIEICKYLERYFGDYIYAKSYEDSFNELIDFEINAHKPTIMELKNLDSKIIFFHINNYFEFEYIKIGYIISDNKMYILFNDVDNEDEKYDTYKNGKWDKINYLFTKEPIGLKLKIKITEVKYGLFKPNIDLKTFIQENNPKEVNEEYLKKYKQISPVLTKIMKYNSISIS